MRLFKSDWVDRVLLVLKIPDDVPIENKRVTSAIANAQGQVESQNFESRKNVLKYDDVMSRQREVIYGERREVLEGADLQEQVRDVHRRRRRPATSPAPTEGLPRGVGPRALWTALKQLYPVVAATSETSSEQAGGRDGLDRDELIETLQADAQAAYDAREAEVGDEVMRELERRVLLSVLDRKWREHLYEMDYLREGIGLRAYSQRDPLVEYQREGFDMFNAMMDGIKEESVGFLFNLEVQVEDDDEDDGRSRRTRSSSRCGSRCRAAAASPTAPAAPAPQRRSAGAAAHPRQGSRAGQAPQNLTYSAPSEDGEVEVKGTHGHQRRRPVRQGGPQRAVPLRLGQEVQEVPRRAGGPDRPDAARRRQGPGLRRSPGRCRASALDAARTGRRPRGTARRSARGC